MQRRSLHKILPIVRLLLVTGLLFLFVLSSHPTYAYWIWSPETGKFVNPEGAVEDTAEEQYTYASGFIKEGNIEKGIEELKNLLKKYPGARVAPEAQYKLGLAYEDKRDYYAAFKAYNKLVENYPQSDRINEAIEREFKIGNLYLSGRRDKILGIAILPALPRAAEIFKQISETAPFSTYGEKSLFNLAVAYKKQGLYEEALKTLQQFLDNYPDSELTGDAKYQMAETTFERSQRADRDQRVLDEAEERFRTFLKDYPDTTVTDKALKLKQEIAERNAEKNFKIGQYYEKDGYLDSALVYYRDVAENYPNTSWGKLAEERMEVIKEPGKFIKAREDAIYEELTGLERERKAILEKGVTAKGEAEAQTLIEKRSEIETRRGELEVQLTKLQRKKEEDISRRWKAIRRQEEALKGNEKKLKEKMKLLNTNPSEDLNRAFDRWSQSLEAEKISLEREKMELRNLEKELGLDNRNIMERVFPFIGQEGDLVDLYQYKSKELLQLDTDLERLETHMGELYELKRGFLEKLAVLGDEELALFRQEEAFEEKLIGEEESIAGDERELSEERKELFALIDEYNEKREIYKKEKGVSFLGILKAPAAVVTKSVDFILPFKQKDKVPEDRLAGLFEERERLNARIEDQRTAITSIIRTFEEELEAPSDAVVSVKSLVADSTAIDTSDTRQVRKTIKALQREIRSRYEEVEDRHKLKNEYVDELEEALHGKEPSLGYKLQAPGRLIHAFFFGLPDKEVRMRQEAGELEGGKKAVDPDRAQTLQEEIEMQSFLIQVRLDEIKQLEEALEELEGRLKVEGKKVTMRSLLIDKPGIFIRDALRLATGLLPQKDEKERLVDDLDKRTRALHKLNEKLAQVDEQIQTLEAEIKKKDLGGAKPEELQTQADKKLKEEPTTVSKEEAKEAVKSTEAEDKVDVEKLERELEELKKQIEHRRTLYESRKKVIESRRKRIDKDEDLKKAKKEFERRTKEIKKQNSFYGGEIKKIDGKLAKTIKLSVDTLVKEVNIIEEKKQKLATKLDRMDKRRDGRTAILQEEIDRLITRLKTVETEMISLEAEEKNLGLAQAGKGR